MGTGRGGGHAGSRDTKLTAFLVVAFIVRIALAASALLGALWLAVCVSGGTRRAGPPSLRWSLRCAPRQRSRRRRPGAGVAVSGWVCRFRAGVGRTVAAVLMLALGGGEQTLFVGALTVRASRMHFAYTYT